MIKKATEVKKLKAEYQYNLCIEFSQCRIRRTDENNLALERRDGSAWKHCGWYGKLGDALLVLSGPKQRAEKGIELTSEEEEKVEDVFELISNVHNEIKAFFLNRAPRPCKAASESLIPLVWEFKEFVIYRKDSNSLALTYEGRFDSKPVVIGWHTLYRTALWQMLDAVMIGPDIKSLDEVINRVNAFLKWFDETATAANRHVEARDRLPKAPPMESLEE